MSDVRRQEPAAGGPTNAGKREEEIQLAGEDRDRSGREPGPPAPVGDSPAIVIQPIPAAEPPTEPSVPTPPSVPDSLLVVQGLIQGLARDQGAPGELPPRFGDYRLIRKIAAGGQGTVHEAEQISLGRRVAIKQPAVLGRTDQRRIERFRTCDLRLHGRLNHPCIVPVFAAGVENGLPYLVMELIEGEPLSQLLKHRRELGADVGGLSRDERDKHYRTLARVFAGVARGLHHAHRRGVVHLDVKPDNLFWDRRRYLRVLDFGLALALDIAPGSQEHGGTLEYMSPEQATGPSHALTASSDIYSLGATLYETLAGRRPFGGSRRQILLKIREQDPPPLGGICPDVPKDLESIVHRCLEKRPAARYATAEALAQDLVRFTRGEPVEARPRSRSERARRWVWRQRHRIAFLSAGAVAVAIGLAWLIAAGSQARENLVANHRRLVETAAADLACARLLASTLPVHGVRGLRLDLEDLPRRGYSIPFDGSYNIVLAALAEPPPGSLSWTPLAEPLIALSVERLKRAQGMLPLDLAAPYYLAIAGETRAQVRAAPAGGAEAAAGEAPSLGLEAAAGIQRAWSSLQSAGTSDALRELVPLSEKFPGSVGLRILLVWTAFAAGDEAHAEQQLRGLLASAPEQADAILLAAAAFACDLGVPRQAAAWLHWRGSRPACAVALAHLYLSLGSPVDAETAADRLEADDPQRLLILGHVRRSQGRGEEAEDQYRRALKATAFDDRIRLEVAVRSSAAGDPRATDRSTAELSRLLAHPRLGLQAAFHLAGLRLAADEHEEAARLYRQVLASEPTNALARNNLGVTLDMEGRGAESLEEYRRAVALAPRLTIARYNLAWSYQRHMRYGVAVREYEAAARLGMQRSPELHNQLGLCRKRLLDYAGAVQSLQLARELAPDSARVIHNLATVYDWQRQWFLATPLFSRTTKLEPEWVDAWSDLGFCLWRNGAFDEARGALEKALVRNPRFPWASNNLAAILLDRRPFLEAEALKTHVRWFEEACAQRDAAPQTAQALRLLRARAGGDLASFASIDWLFEQPMAWIEAGSEWRARPGGDFAHTDLSWTERGHDDAEWPRCRPTLAGAASGQPGALPPLSGEPPSLCLRRAFEVEDPARVRRLRVSVRVDGGCIVYLNGRRAQTIRIEDEARGPSAMPTDRPWLAEEVWIEAADRLQAGTNVLALRVMDDGQMREGFQVEPFLDAWLAPVSTSEDRSPRAVSDAALALEASTSPHAPELLAYLNAKAAAAAGELGDAERHYRDAWRMNTGRSLADPSAPDPTLRRPEPVLGVARCAGARGDFKAAEHALREGIEAGLGDRPEVWEAWAWVCFEDLGESAAQALAHFPALAATPADRGRGPGADVRWLLEGLARDGRLRINCGGENLTVPGGARWGRDRFFAGGTSWFLRVMAEHPPPAEAAAIYETERAFYSSDLDTDAYQVPLPRGRYRLYLHFAAADRLLLTPPPRFRVRLEGKVGDVECDLSRDPQRVPVVLGPFDVDVRDGRLDLGFVIGSGAPGICGIEIEILTAGGSTAGPVNSVPAVDRAARR